MIQSIVVGNTGIISTDKATEKKGSSSLGFDALLALTFESNEDQEGKGDLIGLLNHVMTITPIIQPSILPISPKELTEDIENQITIVKSPTSETERTTHLQVQSRVIFDSELSVLQNVVQKQTSTSDHLDSPVPFDKVGETTDQKQIDSKQSALKSVSESSSKEQATSLHADSNQSLLNDVSESRPKEQATILHTFSDSSLLKKSSESSSSKQTTSLHENTNSTLLKRVNESNPQEQATNLQANAPDTQSFGQNTLQQNQPLAHVTTDRVSPTPVRVAQFDQDMVKSIQSSLHVNDLGSDGIEATFKLSPEHLGKMDVKVSVVEGMVTADFLASSSTGKDLLESHVQTLRAALEAQGFHIDKINISQQQSASSFLGSFSQKGESQGRQPQQDTKKRNQHDIHSQEKQYQDLDSGWISQINTTA